MAIMVEFVLCFIVLFMISSDFENCSVRAQVSADEKYLEEFLDNLALKFGDSCTSEYNLSDRVDTVLTNLERALKRPNGARLTTGLREALRLDELMNSNIVKKIDRWTLAKGSAKEIERKSNSWLTPIFPTDYHSRMRRGLLDAMDGDGHDGIKRNPSIVERSRSANVKLEHITKALKQLPYYEEEALTRTAIELDQLKDTTISLDQAQTSSSETVTNESKIAIILRALETVCSYGLQILYRFYNSVNFIMSMPVISEELKELKKSGKPLFDTIKLMRHACYLVKLSGNALRSNGTDQVVDVRRVKTATRMLGVAGNKALRSIVGKVLATLPANTVNEDNVQELVSRSFYAALAAIVSRNTACTLSGSEMSEEPRPLGGPKIFGRAENFGRTETSRTAEIIEKAKIIEEAKISGRAENNGIVGNNRGAEINGMDGMDRYSGRAGNNDRAGNNKTARNDGKDYKNGMQATSGMAENKVWVGNNVRAVNID